MEDRVEPFERTGIPDSRGSAVTGPVGRAARPSCDTTRELGERRESVSTGMTGRRWPARGYRRRRPLDDQRGVAPRRKRLQREALLVSKRTCGTLARGAVRAHLGHALGPVLSLLLEVPVIDEAAPVDEIAAQVADRPLDFALGLRATPPTHPRREAPVVRESERLRIADQRAALQPEVAPDHRLHLVEQQLLRYATEMEQRLVDPIDQRASPYPGAG